ncbi:alpha/beta fold hydrolase [Vibrio sp. SCSIO 43136]|uniref:alpha/beta hydrolase n=1 Tax=Vibrio sp. SCSIO 43136 TaxID=2819101 RepID=UPI00207564CC|nr:alpha/beta fold hydrolase [Vibrio sp. SCSIO 43136]USD67206.1 alpha/beta hydrolase [Vibrio sp. SCSIO 43136]
MAISFLANRRLSTKLIASLCFLGGSLLASSNTFAGIKTKDGKVLEKPCPSAEFGELFFGQEKSFGTSRLDPLNYLLNKSSYETQEMYLIWLTDQTNYHGSYRIQSPFAGADLVAVGVACEQLTPGLEQALIATRKMVSPNQTLALDTHYMGDLGLSFDQIVQLQGEAFLSANKEQPPELYETIAELAYHIDNSQVRAKSRSLEDEYFIQTVYYATTRAPEQDDDVYYGGERDVQTPLRLGQADISIPKNHERGAIEQPWLSLKWLKQPNKHVLIQSVTEMKPDSFWQSLPIKQGQGAWDNSVIVYIHGYNVAFRSALKRTAQMAYDFNFSGVPLLFSWPSNGSLLDYASDREDAMWSATYLTSFLDSLDDKYPDSNVHIVAHSMGNQVLLNALNEMALQDQSTRFSSVILAAPDVDSQWFEYQLAPRIQNLAHNWAIYTSENDGALIASEKVNQARRLGMPVSLVEGVDVIDTSGLNAAPWSIPESHSYYANKLPVIEDLIAHLKGIDPDQRNLLKASNAQGNYWRMIDEE